jgi:hypothetical protein
MHYIHSKRHDGVNNDFLCIFLPLGHAVAQMVEALCYKPEGRGFESRFFNLPNPPSHTMALGFTQLLTEMSTRRYFCCKARSERKADNLTVIYEPIVYTMWDPQHLTNL